MKKIIICILAVCFINSAYSSDQLDKILTQIRENNKTIKYLRELKEAKKLGNSTGLYPENPEVNVENLWTSAPELGSRRNISVTQKLDFPTAYFDRIELSTIKDNYQEVYFLEMEKSILLEAKVIYSNIIYFQNILDELKIRLEFADKLSEAISKMFDNGEANIIEKNKAFLFKAEAQLKFNNGKRKLEFFTSKLVKLNGNSPVKIASEKMQIIPVAEDFQDFYNELKSKNNYLELSKIDIEKKRQEIELQKSLNLPKIGLGYTGEFEKDADFSGVNLSVSIPLWENSNKLDAKKAELVASESKLADVELEELLKFQSMHESLKTYYTMIETYKSSLKSSKNDELLQTSYQAGEISLIEYLMELKNYYSYKDDLLNSEKEYMVMYVEMMKYF
jgi:outer membrane protein TolC